MENTCKVSYVWDWDICIKSMSYVHKQLLRKSFVIAIGVFSILLAALSIFILTDSSADIGARISGIVGISFAIYWILLRRKIGEWIYRRKFNKNIAANKLSEWTFDGKGYTYHCDDHIHIEAAWKLYSNVVETPEGFLFCVNKNLFFWLPFDKFDTDDGPEIFRRLAKENHITFRQID